MTRAQFESRAFGVKTLTGDVFFWYPSFHSGQAIFGQAKKYKG